jgi:hypothetical protein
VPFTRDDIEPIGWVPGTTAHDYSVTREGEEIGVARYVGAVGLVDRGEDPREWIARRLTEVEQAEGFDKLASALRATLEI